MGSNPAAPTNLGTRLVLLYSNLQIFVLSEGFFHSWTIYDFRPTGSGKRHILENETGNLKPNLKLGVRPSKRLLTLEKKNEFGYLRSKMAYFRKRNN